MRHFLILLLCLLAICSCSRSVHSESEVTTQAVIPLNGLEVSIKSHDLSEDANPISTQNDEVVLLIYSVGPRKELPSLLLREYFTLDSTHRSVTFPLQDVSELERELTVVLIEMDSKLTLSQIEPIVRLNLDSFMSPSQREESKLMRELLGDDDLLGVCRFNTADIGPKGKTFEIKGRRLFDSYRYVVNVHH